MDKSTFEVMRGAASVRVYDTVRKAGKFLEAMGARGVAAPLLRVQDGNHAGYTVCACDAALAACAAEGFGPAHPVVDGLHTLRMAAALDDRADRAEQRDGWMARAARELATMAAQKFEHGCEPAQA